MNVTEAAAEDLLGFRIRVTPDGRKGRWLGGGRIFEEVNYGPSKSQIRSDKAPLQVFQWSDYTVDPGMQYTYRVVPVYGTPTSQQDGDAVEVSVRTEDPDDGTHAIYFNRGVAGSQAYSRRFGKYRRWYPEEKYGQTKWTEFLRPEDVPNRAAYKWLSRGLEEALLGFIGQASGAQYSLRAALYELTYAPAIQAFVTALESGADVKIVHHSKLQTTYDVEYNKQATSVVTFADSEATDTFKKRAIVKGRAPDGVAQAAGRAVDSVGLKDIANRQAFEQMLISRTKATISHNKFIVLLRDGQPVAVWTGSTNITEGGIFGQSNVGHIVRDPTVAAKYLAYWEKLSVDPEKSSGDDAIRKWTVAAQPDLTCAPPAGAITPIFSPRESLGMLQWYADRLAAAGSSVHFTAAFSVADEVYEKVLETNQTDAPYLRYLMLESRGGHLRTKYPQMAAVSQNCIAWGATLKKRSSDDADKNSQFIETLTGLNSHVNYLHTKFMLIDPLSDDPVVITGSANFSNASTKDNDENMLIIRGNTRVADIFLGEFMRLFNHFRSRNISNARTDEEAARAQFLAPDSSWTASYYDTEHQDFQERRLFAAPIG